MILLALIGGFALQSQASFGEIHGKVFDENGLELIGASVIAEAGEKQIGTSTDIDGKFKIKPLSAGIYNVSISFIGLRTVIRTNVKVSADKITFLEDVHLKTAQYMINEGAEIVEERHKRIDPEITGIVSIGADELEHNPLRKNLAQFIGTMSPEIKMDANGDLSIRGARPSAVVYFVDGMKIYGQFRNLPSSGVGSISVYTGGVPAKYGDTTSGVIVVESKNYFDLYNQWKYSQ